MGDLLSTLLAGTRLTVDDLGVFGRLMAFLGVAGMIGAQLARRRQAMREFPAVPPDDVRARAASWRWSEPDPTLGLAVEQSTGASVLSLPSRFTFEEIIGSLFGAVFAVFGLWACGGILWSGIVSPVWTIFVAGFFGIPAWVGLQTRAPILEIRLQPDSVVVIQRIGLVGRRPLVFPARKKPRFSGRVESIWTMTRGSSSLPDFHLEVRQRSRIWKFIAFSNPTAGSWLVSELVHWQNSQQP